MKRHRDVFIYNTHEQKECKNVCHNKRGDPFVKRLSVKDKTPPTYQEGGNRTNYADVGGAVWGHLPPQLRERDKVHHKID